MAAMTRYLQKKLLDHTLGKAAYTMPDTVYVALFTANPGEDGSLAAEIPSGVGYARAEVTSIFGETDLMTGQAVNDVAFSFGPATDDWGTVTHSAIVDAPTGGNVLLYGALVEPKVFATGDSTQYAPGGFTVIFE